MFWEKTLVQRETWEMSLDLTVLMVVGLGIGSLRGLASAVGPLCRSQIRTKKARGGRGLCPGIFSEAMRGGTEASHAWGECGSNWEEAT